MPHLPERTWRLKYTPDDGDLVEVFYVPALRCAKYYDRSTGYFSAPALALAMRGIEGLVRNDGRMRLVVGCTLDPEEVSAIEKGSDLRAVVARHLEVRPIEPPDAAAHDALELLAWMIAHGFLEVKVAVPCGESRLPITADGIFHEKAGVIEDTAGNRLAFNGSINETPAGWKHNWESFNVFTSWSGTAEYVEREIADFAAIWANTSKRVVTLDVPEAARADLLRFLPKSDLPARLADKPVTPAAYVQPTTAKKTAEPDLRREVWRYIRAAPTLPQGGDQVGEATCNVEPWPHQTRVFERLYAQAAPRLLLADEVGLGKTIEAGLLLRQVWLAGRAKRILILTPAAVMRQWQIELREKFNLNWPVYDDGRLRWYPSPALRGCSERPVSRSEWHKEGAVISSSHLMRRRDREREVCEDAEPWDLIVLDEAHHARRKGAGSVAEEGPNALLRLMRRLRHRTRGLVLLTATPMQVHPVEVWDLLDLLGLPAGWAERPFLRFFEISAKAAPSHQAFDDLAAMFRAAEAAYGEVTVEQVTRLGVESRLRAKRILKALRDESNIPRHALDAKDRTAALRVMRATTPVSKLVARHTRDLLRRYYRAGMISTPIADRDVRDEFIEMSQAERAVYEAVEDYISTTYKRAEQADGRARTAIGFVMTVYRRRLASSFRALRCTLDARLAPLASQALDRAAEEDVSEDETLDEVMAPDEAAALEQEALQLEERRSIEELLSRARQLPPDTKARRLISVLEELRRDGYRQTMVFTQFTDTMDFLRDFLVAAGSADDGGPAGPPRILCFSGRGGEVLGTDGQWRTITRDEVKRRFREGMADVLLCTDAAAEGLNFQFCGSIVNYDMPWNPMRVEQRIGRIDRVGQQHPVIRIINLHYRGTVETDVYMALRKRIGLFQTVVGRLQPILAELPRRITETVLRGGRLNEEVRAQVASLVVSRVDAIEAEPSGLDLDLLGSDVLEEPVRPTPALDLAALDTVIRRSDLMPPGISVKPLAPREYSYQAPGMEQPLRVTTNADFFEANPESVELWSPGSPVFPDPADVLGAAAEDGAQLPAAMQDIFVQPGPT